LSSDCGQPLKNQNAASRRQNHYLHFAPQCQQKPVICGNSRQHRGIDFFDRTLLQKCHAHQASWGKLENRFARIPETLVSESPYLYLNKQLLERMRRT
ncbi:hypothetical protein, partial [Rhizobium ruizarguesonis]|uniref:hypothetical protein n=1 Tax=Rhizobium ruizarguesonis TaxID=2081791 RepID=UPI001A7E8383